MTVNMIIHMIENRIQQLKELSAFYKDTKNDISFLLTEARLHELEALVDDIELSGYIEEVGEL